MNVLNSNVYIQSKELVKCIYLLLRNFPKNETYAMCDQLRRAVISVPSNIVEGLSRRSDKEKLHFIEIAYGSLMEVYCQIDIAKDLGFVSQEQFEQVKTHVEGISKQLSGLRRNIQSILFSQS